MTGKTSLIALVAILSPPGQAQADELVELAARVPDAVQWILDLTEPNTAECEPQGASQSGQHSENAPLICTHPTEVICSSSLRSAITVSATVLPSPVPGPSPFSQIFVTARDATATRQPQLPRTMAPPPWRNVHQYVEIQARQQAPFKNPRQLAPDQLRENERRFIEFLGAADQAADRVLADPALLLADHKKPAARLFGQPPETGFVTGESRERYLFSQAVDIASRNAYRSISRGLATQPQPALPPIQIVTASHFAQSGGRLPVQLIEKFIEVCGQNGMSLNAFLYTRDSHAIVVCPGLALHTMLYAPDVETAADQISFVIGHEIGHAIDARRRPSLYRNMSRCLITQELDQVRLSGDFDLEDGMGARSRSQFVELSADSWGIRALIDRIRDRNLSPYQVDELTRRTFSFLCNNAGTGTHPSSELRLGRMALQHPELRALLGCPRHSRRSCVTQTATR